ncbi:MAG: LPP20 family lipoprotein [Thermodesulfobacteriota bacterium]
MNKIKIVFICIFVLMLAGCVSSVSDNGSQGPENPEEIPSWVYSPPSSQGYVYGVGMASIYASSGEALTRAKENARLELVKQLRVKVSGETEASVKREISGGKSEITRSVFNYAKSSVEETELPGIKIIETAVAKKDKQAYALAELNMSMAELDMTDQLESYDRQIQRIIESPKPDSKIRNIQRLLPVLNLIEKRRKLVSDIRLVSNMSDAEYETKQHTEVRRKIADLLDSLVIVLKPDSSGEKISSGIRKALSDQGIRVRMSGKGDLYMNFSASLNTVYKDGVFFTFATGRASVMEENKDIISEFSSRVKAGSSDSELSSKRAVEKLASELGRSIAKGLFESA